MKRILICIILAVLLLVNPHHASAGFFDDFSRAKAWWISRSVAADPTEAPQSPDTQSEPGGSETPAWPTGRQPGMCSVPREPDRTSCRTGGGFLCVETPPGGIAAESFRIKGVLDRSNSLPAAVRIAVQNEYTNRMAVIDTSSPVDGDCWSDVPPEGTFCLARDGKFSAQVDLPLPGPYSVYVSATRLSGAAEEKRLRTSRVMPLRMDLSNIEITPDVRVEGATEEGQISVKVKLLGECRFCDFIGASTGGVRVTVANSIRDARGRTQNISCESRVEQGGQGHFVIGVPVLGGTNTLSISACNAADEPGACPTVNEISFQGHGGFSASGLNIIGPPPAPAYDSGAYPKIDWVFSLDGADECVDVEFNRDPVQEICKNGEGRFAIELNPKVGINIATVATTGQRADKAWTFGWGKVLSPYANERRAVEIPSSVELAVPSSTFQNIILPFANNFLKSDEFQSLLGRLTQPAGEGASSPISSPAEQEIPIPGCAAAGEENSLQIELNDKPVVQAARLQGLNFDDGKIDLSAVLDGVRVGVNLKTGAGRNPLPLIIAFHRAIIDVTLESQTSADGKPLLLVSSPHDDCEFKNGTYCRHVPTPLVPARFAGAANSWGGFVVCDVEHAAPDVRDACQALNAINNQTAIVGEQVVDAINSVIYCGGSRLLTKFARGDQMKTFHLGCRQGEECASSIMRVLPNVDLPIGIKLENNPQISDLGILLATWLISGNSDTYASTPSIYHIPEAGVILADNSSRRSIGSVSDVMGDVDIAVSLNALNAILFVAVTQGDGISSKGLLDFDLHEKFFNSMGFDFVKECDEFTANPDNPDVEMSKLCLLRPRLKEITGNVITNYGYFPEYSVMQPLMIAIRGGRALAPRVAVTTLSDLPVVPIPDISDATAGGESDPPLPQNYDNPSGSFLELEIGGLGFSLYALEVDEDVPSDQYGNLTLKLDAAGNPIIHSMRQDDPNPMNGPIVSYDISLLLGIEISALANDPNDLSKYFMTARLLSDRSRLVIVPVFGGNSTTIPPMSIIAKIYEYLNVMLAEYSRRDNAFRIEIPKEIPLEIGNDESLFASFGLKTLRFADGGLSLDFDPSLNAIRVALRAVLTQVLHEGGEEVRRSLP